MKTLSDTAIAKLGEVGDAITNEENYFNMKDYFVSHDCDSPSCMLGWLVYLNSGDDDFMMTTGCKILGVDTEGPLYEELYKLFHGDDMYLLADKLDEVSRQGALIVLDNFIKTGITDWSLVYDKNPLDS